MAWSDTPYLALSLLVLMMAFNIMEKKAVGDGPFIVLMGILSGISFLVRYIGISLIVSIGLWLIIAFVIRRITLKDFVRTSVFYGFGICLPVIPFFIRNFIVFGRISTYLSPLPGSHLFSNLMVMTQSYFQGLSTMMFGSGSLSWSIPIIIVCVLFWFFSRMNGLLKDSPTKFMCLVLLLMYFFINSFFLIYNTSKAFIPGNPHVETRLLIQLSWMLMGGGVFAVSAGLKRWCRIKGDRTILAVFSILIFVFIQIFLAMGSYKTLSETKLLAQRISQYFPAPAIPADDVIVSNVPDITYYFAHRNVRTMDNYTPYGLLTELGITRNFVVFLVKGCGHLSPNYLYASDWQNPQGYKCIYTDDLVDLWVPVVKYRKSLGK